MKHNTFFGVNSFALFDGSIKLFCYFICIYIFFVCIGANIHRKRSYGFSVV